MNIQTGLGRVSAMIFGAVALFIAFGAAVLAYEGKFGNAAGVALGIVGCYVAHRVIVWVIAGFTGKN